MGHRPRAGRGARVPAPLPDREPGPAPGSIVARLQQRFQQEGAEEAGGAGEQDFGAGGCRDRTRRKLRRRIGAHALALLVLQLGRDVLEHFDDRRRPVRAGSKDRQCGFEVADPQRLDQRHVGDLLQAPRRRQSGLFEQLLQEQAQIDQRDRIEAEPVERRVAIADRGRVGGEAGDHRIDCRGSSFAAPRNLERSDAALLPLLAARAARDLARRRSLDGAPRHARHQVDRDAAALLDHQAQRREIDRHVRGLHQHDKAFGAAVGLARAERDDPAAQLSRELFLQRGLDIGGKQIAPVDDEHVAQATADEQFPAIEEAEIAGAEIGPPARVARHARLEMRAACLGHPPVAGRLAWAVDPDFADLAVAERRMAVGVDNATSTSRSDRPQLTKRCFSPSAS